MQNSQRPAKWLKPFAADDANKVEIPLTSADPTRASQSAGFPPLTMQPPESGGVPPQGEDFNGAMNQVARIAWWLMGGGSLPYDATWAGNVAIGGYPNGAQIPAADLRGTWFSTADNNANDPDATGTNWVPGYAYGATTIGTVGVNLATSVTLTPAQAAKGIIFIQGNLTAATTIIFPAWVKNWLVVNNTGTGAFALTVKTAAGVGVVVNRGDVVPILCDGTNMSAAQRAQSANIARFTANGSFTVPPGVSTIYVSACAAGSGGGGGGGATNSLGVGAGGAGGGAGQAIIRQPYTVTPGTVIALTVPSTGGTGGAAGTPTVPGVQGAAGANTVVGSLVTLTGAGLTGGGFNFSSGVPAGGAAGTGFPSGTSGADGASGFNGGVGVGGVGASGPFGGGGGGGRSGSTGVGGAAAGGFGAGGGGAGGSYGSGGGGSNGGVGDTGSGGLVIIEW